jgi:hypothetical protein
VVFVGCLKASLRVLSLTLSSDSVWNRIWWSWLARSGLVLVFNAIFNNISVISWRFVLLVEETGLPGENKISYIKIMYWIQIHFVKIWFRFGYWKDKFFLSKNTSTYDDKMEPHLFPDDSSMLLHQRLKASPWHHFLIISVKVHYKLRYYDK